MAERLAALLVWAAAAACAVFWALRLGVTPLAAPAAAVAVDAPRAHADLSLLLGAAPAASVAGAAAPPPTAESARFRLLGVIADTRSSAAGVALLVIDGRPPRALRAGASIDGSLVLQSVTRRGVTIGPPGAPASVVLELPPLPLPAIGEPLRLAADGSVVVGGRTSGSGLPPVPSFPLPSRPGVMPPPVLPGLGSPLPGPTGLPMPLLQPDAAAAAPPPSPGIDPAAAR